MKKLFLLTFLLVFSGCGSTSETTYVEVETLADSPTETSEPVEAEGAPSADSPSVYEDDFLSFSYPNDIELVVEIMPEGRGFKSLQFIYWDEALNVYSPVGLSLYYPYHLPNISWLPEGVEDYESLLNYYENESLEEYSDVLSFERLDSGGFLVLSGGIGSGEYADLYAPMTGEGYTSADVYSLSRDGILIEDDLYQETLDQFVKTVEYFL